MFLARLPDGQKVPQVYALRPNILNEVQQGGYVRRYKSPSDKALRSSGLMAVAPTRATALQLLRNKWAEELLASKFSSQEVLRHAS